MHNVVVEHHPPFSSEGESVQSHVERIAVSTLRMGVWGVWSHVGISGPTKI